MDLEFRPIGHRPKWRKRGISDMQYGVALCLTLVSWWGTSSTQKTWWGTSINFWISQIFVETTREYAPFDQALQIDGWREGSTDPNPFKPKRLDKKLHHAHETLLQALYEISYTLISPHSISKPFHYSPKETAYS